MDYNTLFSGLGTISTPHDPRYTAIGTSSKLVVLAFLAVFVGYNTLFWGPETISMSRDPRYMDIGMSSTLVVLAISGRFRGL